MSCDDRAACICGGCPGDGWIPTKSDPQEYADRLAVIHRSAEQAGRDPQAITPSMLAYVLCAPAAETLDRLCENPMTRRLFAAVDRASYKPKLEQPWDDNADLANDQFGVFFMEEYERKLVRKAEGRKF